MSEIRCVRLAPSHAPELAALFERHDLPCYCRFFEFEGDKNAWLDRCANAPLDNRRELEDASHDTELQGVVALTPANRVAGWMKIVHSARVPKLYAQRPYRGLPCFGADREGVFVIGCFLVDESERRRGLARALLQAGLAEARRSGARAVEAFPRRAEGLADAELWTGPFALLVEAGFEIVNDFGPYPVLRRTL